MKQQLTLTHPFQFIDEIFAQQSVNLLSLNPQKTLNKPFQEMRQQLALKLDIQPQRH